MNAKTILRIEQIALLLVFLCMITIVILFTIDKGFITDQGLVIGFFGLLATFVVIGNYTQTERIRQQTENDINKLSDLNDEKSLLYRIEKLKKDLYNGDEPKVKTINDDLENKVTTMVTQKLVLLDQQYTTLVKTMFAYLIPKDHMELVETTINKNKSFECRVTSGNKVKRVATARREGPVVVFRDKQGKVIEPVETLNGIPYNHIAICNIINLWDKVSQSIIDKKSTEFISRGKNHDDLAELAENLKFYQGIAKEQRKKDNEGLTK